MPRVDPEHSFEAAARHLFRHICEIDALRLNPLLRPYFASAAGTRRVSLEEVHTEIFRLADALCDELESKGRTLQAQRRREIVAALCAGKTVANTASSLRISRSHYYRERHAICSRIARTLAQSTATDYARFVVRDDSLRLLFARAESLRDAGFSKEAVRILEAAYPGVADGPAKSAVGLSLAEELVFLGRRDRARELFANAYKYGAEGAKGAASEWLNDMCTLNSARLRSQLGGDASAGSDLQTFARRRIAERRNDDVTFDAVFLSGEWYRNSGAYSEARKMLGHLRAMEQRRGRTVAKRQIGVLLLAAYCAESSSDELGVAEDSLRDARDLSIANGTVVGALLATSGLIHHEAARGREDAVYAMAHDALRLADGVDFDGFLGYVVAEIIDALLQTHYWRAAAPLVFDAERFTVPGTLRHALLKRAQGTFFFRTGRRSRAREAMLEAYNIAERLGNRRLEGLILRDRAMMLSGDCSGLQGELMREAVRIIEPFGSASDLSTTYGMAAQVLGDQRSVRLARQLSPAPVFAPGLAREARHSLRIRPLRLAGSTC